jgi:arylformamidase
MTRFIDISLGIGPDLLTWPTDPGIEITPSKRIAKGDGSNVSELKLGTHTGTHVDPPFHFVDGAPTIDKVSVEQLVGPARVADLRGFEGSVGPDEFEALKVPDDTTRLLLKTDNSEIWRQRKPSFPDKYVNVSPKGAAWLVDNGIVLIGVDFLSIEEAHAAEHPTHKTLLEAGVVIVEGLNLGDVEPGDYELMCLPLKIVDGDGAPARAVLISR